MKCGLVVPRDIFCNQISIQYCSVTRINVPIVWIPYSDTCVQAACRDFLPIKGNRVDLAEVPCEGTQALALGYTPNLRCCVVAARHDNITVYLEAPYASLVANQNVLAQTFLEVPNA